jgi:hypothetical protein
MSASKSDSRSETEQYRDSFNRTYNEVTNLSDVGNTTINYGGDGEDNLIKHVLPYSLAALGVITAAIIFSRK